LKDQKTFTSFVPEMGKRKSLKSSSPVPPSSPEHEANGEPQEASKEEEEEEDRPNGNSSSSPSDDSESGSEPSSDSDSDESSGPSEVPSSFLSSPFCVSLGFFFIDVFSGNLS
jgi:hypothetical protein